jgi:hypothetical protein
MKVLRRLAVWLIETCCEAILLMLMILVTSAPSAQRTIVDDVPLAFFGTVIVFMIGSGYWLTTALGRLFLSSRTPWVYPTISSVLFLSFTNSSSLAVGKCLTEPICRHKYLARVSSSSAHLLGACSCGG